MLDGTWSSEKIAKAHPTGVTSVSWAPASAPGSIFQVSLRPASPSQNPPQKSANPPAILPALLSPVQRLRRRQCASSLAVATTWSRCGRTPTAPGRPPPRCSPATRTGCAMSPGRRALDSAAPTCSPAAPRLAVGGPSATRGRSPHLTCILAYPQNIITTTGQARAHLDAGKGLRALGGSAVWMFQGAAPKPSSTAHPPLIPLSPSPTSRPSQLNCRAQRS